MPTNISLNDLIEGLAGAVIEAQDRIEQHQIANLLGYFDENQRPKSLVVRMPTINPNAVEGSEDLYRTPLLPLVSSNPIKIKEMEVSFDVDLSELKEKSLGESDDKGNKHGSKKNIFVDMAGGKSKTKGGSIHVVLRVDSSEPTEGAARLINHLAQVQGVYKTMKVD
jgi:hypothetical protein